MPWTVAAGVHIPDDPVERLTFAYEREIVFDYQALERLQPDWCRRDMEYPALATLDWYGVTVLDGPAIERLLPEWQQLVAALSAGDDLIAAQAITQLLLYAHRHGQRVVFIGD